MNSQCYPSPGPADNLSFLWSGQPFPSDRMAQRMHLSPPERQPQQGKEASCTCAGTVTRLWEAFRAKTAVRALLSTNKDSPTPRPHAQSSTPPATPRDEACGLAGSHLAGPTGDINLVLWRTPRKPLLRASSPILLGACHSSTLCSLALRQHVPLSASLEGRDPEACIDIKLQKGD